MSQLLQLLQFTPPPPDKRRVRSNNPGGRNGYEVLGERRQNAAIDRYCAALVTVPGWINTADLAKLIGLSKVAVNRTLKQEYMRDYIDQRFGKDKASGARQNLWKLRKEWRTQQFRSVDRG